MKPKIITGEETVGYYFSGNKILSKTYNELSEDEQQDYLTDDDRKYIFIDTHSGSFNSFLQLYYTKEFLIEAYIEGIKDSINHQERILKTTTSNIILLQNDLTKYIEMLYVVKLGESK